MSLRSGRGPFFFTLYCPASAPIFFGLAFGIMTLMCHAIRCRRGGRLLFSDLNLRLIPGQTGLILGPNGAGKSSFLRLLAGLLPADTGHISWNGQDIAQDREGYGAQLHYCGHLDGVKPAFTAREHLRFWTALGCMDATRQRLDEVLAQWGLSARADDAARFLSAGQRRRLALARLSLVTRPLWLLDEPSATLDQEGLDVLQAALSIHATQGGIVVIASHEPDLWPAAQPIYLGATHMAAA